MPGKINPIFDSDILINYSKDELNLDIYFDNYGKIFISVITYMEVFGYEFKNKNEENLLKEIIENIDIININEDIINKVIEVRKKFKVKLPDAIIFATATYLNADLITRNEDYFSRLT